ncbi:MAG: hypothetical protein MJ221_00600 [Bacilli bacterium]|nr:hypothetical protein [Bacilli bacterium]
MKHLLFAVFENSNLTHDIIQELAENGINGTVLASTSLKHFMNDLDNDVHFVSLRHFEKVNYEENTTFYTLLEENQIELATSIIRDLSGKFTKIKGGMFVVPVEKYEGSF